MTTIAYKDGVLASDTLAVYGGNARESSAAQKIMRGRDGSLYAVTGDFGVVHAYASKLARGEIPDPLPKDCGRVIHVAKSGKITVHESGGKYPLGTKVFAYGSGSDAARGAMLMGATSARAVRVASKIDVFTGGNIRTLKLKR